MYYGVFKLYALCRLDPEECNIRDQIAFHSDIVLALYPNPCLSSQPRIHDISAGVRIVKLWNKCGNQGGGLSYNELHRILYSTESVPAGIILICGAAVRYFVNDYQGRGAQILQPVVDSKIPLTVSGRTGEEFWRVDKEINTAPQNYKVQQEWMVENTFCRNVLSRGKRNGKSLVGEPRGTMHEKLKALS